MKFNKPNIKIKLSIILWIIFLVVVLLELFVLYQAFWAKPELVSDEEQTPTAVLPQINLEKFDELVKWLESRQAYRLEDYKLQEGDKGRENPFLEYK